MKTNPHTQAAQTAALRTGKRLAAFIQDEAKKAGDTGDIRIDVAQIKAAKASSANLLRCDVPRFALDKSGKRVPVPDDLKDQFNPLYKDASGVNVAANHLPPDFDDQPNLTPSPAHPLIALREVWPVLLTVPFMALAGIHWTIGVAVLLARQRQQAS